MKFFLANNLLLSSPFNDENWSKKWKILKKLWRWKLKWLFCVILGFKSIVIPVQLIFIAGNIWWFWINVHYNKNKYKFTIKNDYMTYYNAKFHFDMSHILKEKKEKKNHLIIRKSIDKALISWKWFSFACVYLELTSLSLTGSRGRRFIISDSACS